MKRTALLSLFLFVSLPLFAQSQVYVLDAGSNSVVRLGMPSGTIDAKGVLPISDASRIVATPDGRQLVVLSRGKGREYSSGFRPESNASAVIVDAATHSASPRLELGRGIGDAVFTRDGKSVIVFSTGYLGMPGALHRIDLPTATVSKQVSLDRVADQFGAVSDDTGVVFAKGGKNTNGRLSFVSLDSLEVIATVDLTGKATELVSIPGSGYLYAVEGDAVDVVSIAGRKLENTLPVGKNAKLGGIDEASGTLFVTADKDKKEGMVYAIRGFSIAGSSSIGGSSEVFRLTADGKRAFAGSSRGVTQLSTSPLAVESTAPLYSGMVANSLTTIDSAATADGRRVFLLMRQYDKCCTLTIADPIAGSKVASMQVGRTSKRVVQALLAVAATAASFSAGRADAREHGRSSFYYSIYSPAAARNPRGAFAFGPDAKTVYVVDSGTDSVTAVDVDSGKRIIDFAAPGSVREVIPLGPTILATGEKGLALIDSTTNTAAETVSLEGTLHDVVTLPETTTALALSKGGLAIIDGGSKKVTSRVAGLTDPIAVAIVSR